MRKLILISCILIIGTLAFAQSKSEIKEFEIKSTTIWNYDYSTGKEIKKIESITKFNKDGLPVELTDYDKTGKFKERIEFTYNANKDIVEEKYFAQNSKLTKSYKYTYEGKLLLTKEKYGADGKLEWRKEYSYEM